ncbi:MAG TPA: hypothetical protein VIZ43_18455, partial [Trebonia sp.]
VPAFAPSAFAPSSPFAPSPAFASSRAYAPASRAYAPARAYESAEAYYAGEAYYPAESSGASTGLGGACGFASPPLSAPVAPVAPSAPVAPTRDETDALYRAWQGSVREAATRRTPWTARRPSGGGRRGRGWQVAKIGVPAVVIVTVGAGALMMLTGRANDMLAERASTGALSSTPASTGPAPAGQASVGTTSLTLAGYPAQHGAVGVSAMWSAAGATMAVGFADGHPAVWRHAPGAATWSLVSTTVLGGLTGHLTSVAQGPSGWIAVGSVNENGTVEPAVFESPDGVTWQTMTALTALAGRGAQFRGVAAGPGGYLVVGKQQAGNQTYAAMWWSGDLKNWVTGDATHTPGSLAASAATVEDGFVAVGSENSCHTIWTSADGQHWTAHDLAKPSGATTATLRTVAVGEGGRFVAAGFATGTAGDVPIVVTSADDGAQVTQTVLNAGGAPATVTAVAATGGGYVAAGLAGSGKAQHAVTWTSPDGVTWSSATPLRAAGTSEVTALATTTTRGVSPAITGTAERGSAPALLNVPAP